MIMDKKEPITGMGFIVLTPKRGIVNGSQALKGGVLRITDLNIFVRISMKLRERLFTAQQGWQV